MSEKSLENLVLEKLEANRKELAAIGKIPDDLINEILITIGKLFEAQKGISPITEEVRNQIIKQQVDFQIEKVKGDVAYREYHKFMEELGIKSDSSRAKICDKPTFTRTVGHYSRDGEKSPSVYQKFQAIKSKDLKIGDKIKYINDPTIEKKGTIYEIRGFTVKCDLILKEGETTNVKPGYNPMLFQKLP